MYSTDLNNNDNTSESESDGGIKYRPFAHLSPYEVEFTDLFPAFPKSHIKGHATVIELNQAITSSKAVIDLRNASQYSLTKGHGQRVETVDFSELMGKTMWKCFTIIVNVLELRCVSSCLMK